MVDPDAVKSTNKVVSGQPEEISESGTAEEAITPGQLVDYGSDSESFVAHATAAEKTLPMVADVAAVSGNPDDDVSPIEDDYASGDYIEVSKVQRGSFANLILDASESVSAGALLVSAGNGNVRQLDTAGGDGQGAVLFKAVESATTGTGETARLIAEVI